MFDSSDKNKQKIALSIFEESVKDLSAVISTQVLQEFYITCTKKLKMEPQEARGYVMNFMKIEVVVNTDDMILEAIDCQSLHKLSFWDSLIVTSASHSKSKYLITEDLNHDQVINGVKIKNPF